MLCQAKSLIHRHEVELSHVVNVRMILSPEASGLKFGRSSHIMEATSSSELGFSFIKHGVVRLGEL